MYVPYNHLEEVVCSYSLAFNPDGSKIYAGFSKCIRVFDTAIPGRSFETRPTYG
jgi:WD-repeat protein, putative (fragment)